ncbi:hypothetical protein ABGB17_14000 [Sphaerisporangium sp. B11E5]|uniref:hypothetical protein n=1 Tax=Sphaerisporangium sp. B11E5 TaxID=3153563 RepID=UPI00325CEF64
MKNVAMVVTLASIALSGTLSAASPAGGPPGAEEKTYVSRDQYRVLLGQCRYADTPAMRAECRTRVAQRYAVGRQARVSLDCRTYSSVTVCGELTLSPREQACVRRAVAQGLTARRAEVECYAFY